MNNPMPLLSHYQFPDGQMVLFNSHDLAPTPNPVFGMHLPPEVGVVLSGHTSRYINGVRRDFPRGALFITSMLEPHGYKRLRVATTVAVFILRPDFLFNIRIPGVENHVWHAPFNTLPEDRPHLVNEEFARMVEQLIASNRADKRPALCAARIQTTLLSILLLANKLGVYAPGKSTTVVTFERLRPAIELIHSSRLPVTTAEAARLCRLSPSRFAQLFARATGLSFARYSLRYRLEQVAHDLKTTDILLDELAAKWGFSDKSHLANRFHEHYRTTPGAYRKCKGEPRA